MRIAAVIAVLAGRELYLRRQVLRGRIGELATYVAMTLGLLILVNGNGFAVRADGSVGFEQARYLFPLLALYAAIMALAARGVGRRYGPAVGRSARDARHRPYRAGDGRHPDSLLRLMTPVDAGLCWPKPTARSTRYRGLSLPCA